MLVDTHCHIHDARFDEDRLEVIKRARAANIRSMISIGCDIETSGRALALAQIHRDIYFSVGFHPHEAKETQSNYLDVLRNFASHQKCVAIGECGLDYYYNHSPKEIQMQVFAEQIELAIELKKALVVHVRDAYQDCFDILHNFPTDRIRVVIHCFSGSLDIAKRFVEQGYYLSIPGVVTFKEPGELVQVVDSIPLDRLLIETDSPYLAPLPFRGKRNEPSYVTKVAEKIALIKNLPQEEISKQLTNTSCFVFNLPALG